MTASTIPAAPVAMADGSLQADAQRFRALVRHLDDLLWMADAGKPDRRRIDGDARERWRLTGDGGDGDGDGEDGAVNWSARVHPDDRAVVGQSLAALFRPAPGDAGPGTFTIEYRLRLADGSSRWVRDRGIAVRDARGTVIEVVGIAEDIDSRRHTEQALSDCERELRIVTSAMPIGIAHFDSGLCFRFVNNAHAVERHGCAPRELIGRTLPEVLGPANSARLKPRIDQVLSGWTVDFEMELALAGGDRHLHLTMVPEHDAQKQVHGFILVTEDITSRKQAQVKLHAREREFKTLADNAPDVIARVDARGRYLYLNRAVETAFGVDRNHYAGRTAAELGFPARYIESTTALLAAVLAGGVEESAPFEVPAPDGLHYFLARAVPEYDDRSRVESLLVIVYDISERVRVGIERDQLLASEQAARETAERATRSRDEFLAIVSHELRSPLNGIQSWAQVLAVVLETVPAQSSPVARRAIEGITAGVAQQVRMIDDLLDATRIITGELSLRMAPVLIEPVLAAAVESVRGKAEEKAIAVRVDLRLGNELMHGDADRLQQIVWNLLSNAIKFTPRDGTVELTAWVDGSEVVISVRDDGRGIDGDFLPRLFERFQRDETGNSRGQDGFGLGLMLVRHLCTMHHGTVTAHSAGLGLGSLFCVRLPLHDFQPAVPPHLSVAERVVTVRADSLRGARLLLVDDHAESRDAMALLLGSVGATVEALGSGEEAVRRVFDPTGLPALDLLICDIAMPGQDGYQTLRLIRAGERVADQPPLPAVALTAFAQNDDRIRAHDAGFAIHLAKPVAFDELVSTVAAFVRHRQRG